jgi:hypothetical protein
LQIPFKFAIFIPNMPHFYKNNRSTDPPQKARSDGIYGGKDTPFTRKDTPSSPFGSCHPFMNKGELLISLQRNSKRNKVCYSPLTKGVPNLYGEAGYPYGYVCNNAVVCVQTGCAAEGGAVYARTRTYKTTFTPHHQNAFYRVIQAAGRRFSA